MREQPEWNVLDSSKLDTFITCPRKYFYEHLLGWRMDAPAHDLYFGQCWHIAREHQLLYGYDDVEGAYKKFEEEYRKIFPPDTDSLYSPKTPTGVLNALIKFKEERSNDLVENELVIIDGKPMTEISGVVPIDENRYLHYRLDSILRRRSDGKIFSWDHKTTTAKYANSRQWQEQFHLSIQNGTYTHCLYCLFPIDQVLGVEFCGVGFEYLSRGSKDRPAGYYATLVRVPAFKTPDQMNSWLWLVNDLVDSIEREMDRLSHCTESDPILMAFPMNPKSCTSYRGCPYHDFCLSWQNPLQYADQPPLGFKVEFWNPANLKSSNKLDLSWR